MKLRQNLWTRNNLPQPFHIRTDSRNIHRDNHFRPLSDSFSQFVIIHLHIILLTVHHHNRGTDVIHHRSSSRVCICRNNHLVAGSHAQNPQRHLHSRSRRIQTNSLFRMDILRNRILKLLCSRTGGDPSAENSITHLICLSLRHIRRTERNISSFQICTHRIMNYLSFNITRKVLKINLISYQKDALSTYSRYNLIFSCIITFI